MAECRPDRFNPSIGLTSVPTFCYRKSCGYDVSCFNPSIGLTSVPTSFSFHGYLQISDVSIPQSGLQAFRPSLGSVIPPRAICFNPSIGLTSVPTPLFHAGDKARQLFQSFNRAYKRSDIFRRRWCVAGAVVSIPQSGLQAFRRLHNTA